MRKISLLLFINIIISLSISGQTEKTKSDLNKLVETEKTFARTAAEKGTRAAFLEFFADDGIVFSPDAVNARELWTSRKDSIALLSWQPAFADISSNGILGYTTGDWEFRPKGKEDNPVAFGQYFTIWRKQPDGNFKAVLDLGVSHPKPEKKQIEWQSLNETNQNSGDDISSATDSINKFYDTAAGKNLNNAYKRFAAEDIRFLRGEKFPILGKKTALDEAKKVKSKVSFGKKMTIQSAGDLAYAATTYQLKNGETIIEKGNCVQVWKFRNGKWQIVMDVFSPNPQEKK